MKVGKDLILVTGATGHQGGAVAHDLLDKRHRVAVLTRKPDSPVAQVLAKRGATVISLVWPSTASCIISV